MVEENQTQQEPKKREENQMQQVTTKDPTKVEAGKKLAEWNRRKREVQKSEITSNQYHSIGAVLAVRVTGVLLLPLPIKEMRSQQQRWTTSALRITSSKWSKFILYYKMDKKSIVNDLYHASIISVFAVGYSMLGKKIMKMAPPSIQKFDLEDTGKLPAIVAGSEMTREYLIKLKILPDHINV